MIEPIDLYLDLMKKTLTFLLWDEAKLFKRSKLDPHPFYKKWLVEAIERRLANSGRQIMESRPTQGNHRIEGRDWPSLAHTMVGLKRLDNLEYCVRSVIEENVPGDLIETGVWRGGACIFMKAVLKAYNITDRAVWLADSFAGLPAPDAKKYPKDSNDPYHTYDVLRVSQEEVIDAFRRYGLLDEHVKFLVGWFRDTLPKAPIEKLGVLRLDGDMYESTWEALVHLYPKLSSGGYCIIDDYFLEGCRAAVEDYRKQHGIEEEIRDIDDLSVFWRRV